MEDKEMHALRWIAYSALAGLLLGFGFLGLNARGAAADTPDNATVSGPVADDADGTIVAAVPDDSAITTSQYATSPYYNPYYNYYAYYNQYYNPYYNYYRYYSYYNPYYNPYYNYYAYSNPYYNPYYNYYSYYNRYNPYYYSSGGSWTYCTVPGGGSVWVAYGQSTAGLICN
jgi:hypothetical protein